MLDDWYYFYKISHTIPRINGVKYLSLFIFAISYVRLTNTKNCFSKIRKMSVIFIKYVG